MIIDVAFVQRLFDHQEPETVPFGDMVRVFDSIGVVGIHHQTDFREAFPDRLNVRGVETGADFKLDPGVAFFQQFFHGGNGFGGRILDADARTGFEAPASAAQQFPDRTAEHLSVDIPDSGIDRSLGEMVAAVLLHTVGDFVRMGEFLVEKKRRESVAEDVRHGTCGLMRIKRSRVHGGLAPAGQVSAAEFEDGGGLVGNDPCADPERHRQRNGIQVQCH